MPINALCPGCARKTHIDFFFPAYVGKVRWPDVFLLVDNVAAQTARRLLVV
jgi:hypothetical protein